MQAHDELMTPGEVARELRVSTSTLRRWRRERKGPEPTWVGERVRYRRSDVKRWLEEENARRKRGGELA